MKKTTYLTAILSIAGKTCFLVAIANMLMPSSVKAQCAKLTLNGDWNMVIANGPSVHVNLNAGDTAFSGSAHNDRRLDLYPQTGIVKGTRQGDKVQFVIAWNDKSGMVNDSFLGTIGQDGKILGQANIFAIVGNVIVDWASDRPMKCLANAINGLKIKPPTSVAAPGIIATPNNIALVAGKGTGKTTLIWDAGAKHPLAEVWVKTDDQNETKLVAVGKGTLQVTVVPSKTYVYTLKDKGQVLATVTVKFHR